jgi:uncharacterized protein
MSLIIKPGFDHEVLMSDRNTWPNQDIGPDTGRSQRVSGNWVARHDLLLYFILAYVVSWSIWPLVLVNPQSSPLVPFGPLIAAVIVALLARGLRELRALLGQLLRWRVHPVWYVIALLGPCVLAAAAAALTVATGAPAPKLEAYTDWLGIGAALLSTIIIVGLFEEVGWRGFALPRLQRGLDALWAALVLGVIWAAWHLPELISDPGQRPPLQFFPWIVAQSVILAWLYNSTNGSLPIVIICHAAVNTAGRFVLPEFSGESYQVVWWFMVGLYVVIAVLVTRLGGAKRLATSIPQRSTGERDSTDER